MRFFTAVLIAAASFAAIDAKPAHAYGYGSTNCWYEVHYYPKNWGGCFPQFRNGTGQVIHICCG